MFFIFVSAIIINIPADQPTIQAGIDVAVDADTVLVQPGTYVENINFNGKAIILGSLFHTTQDTSYISQTIIDGNQDDTVVAFDSEEDSTSVLTGFTIINGNDYYKGGGISCSSSSPSLQNLTISDNSAAKGGGIQCQNYSNPSLSNLTIANNTAEEGGGIYCENSSPTLVDVNIMDNYGIGYGAGICCQNYSNPNLQNVIIVDNYAIGFGGGIYCFNNSCPSLDNVMIANNEASPHGGGIYCETNSNPILENVTIANNSGGYSGGGIFCHSSHPNLKNVTITNNLAVYGGGIYCCANSNPIIINCILWNDTPEEIYYNDYGQPNSTTISYSDIEGGLNAIVTNNNGSVNWLEGNIDINPLFVDPSIGDYNLQSTSPCIDAGDPSSPLDPDGTIRDMGAYYFHQIINCDFIADIVSGFVPLEVNFTDLSQGYIEEWQWDFNNNGTIDSYEQNPSFTYNEAGVYSVSLTVSNSALSNNLTIIDYITVNPVSNAIDLLPFNTKLHQNYPNPFNPMTTINFDIKENETGTLTLFNIKGQIIQSHQFESGKHNYLWNASNQASGIYFYKLQTQTITETRKMLLLR